MGDAEGAGALATGGGAERTTAIRVLRVGADYRCLERLHEENAPMVSVVA